MACPLHWAIEGLSAEPVVHMCCSLRMVAGGQGSAKGMSLVCMSQKLQRYPHSQRKCADSKAAAV